MFHRCVRRMSLWISTHEYPLFLHRFGFKTDAQSAAVKKVQVREVLLFQQHRHINLQVTWLSFDKKLHCRHLAMVCTGLGVLSTYACVTGPVWWAMSARLTTLDTFINKQASKIWDAKRGTTAGEVQREVLIVRLHSLPLGSVAVRFSTNYLFTPWPNPLNNVCSERGLGTRAWVIRFTYGQQSV